MHRLGLHPKHTKRKKNLLVIMAALTILWALLTATAFIKMGGQTVKAVQPSDFSHLTVQPQSPPPPAPVPQKLTQLQRLSEASWASPCNLVNKPLAVEHVIWIWFENQKPQRALGGQAASQLAANCGSTSNYYGLTHPSLPNYLAAVSGSDHRIFKNCWCIVSGPSLMSQVKSWKLYAESMPTNCAKDDTPPYAAHHNVALHFDGINCAGNDVPMSEFYTALAHNDLPEFSFILPNECHSMHYAKHGCHPPLVNYKLAVRSGNLWLRVLMGRILNSQEYVSGHTVIMIAWDEGTPVEETGEHCLRTRSPDCQTAAIVVSPSTRIGSTDAALTDPYSLLRTTEQMLGLPLIGGARTANGMNRAFNLPVLPAGG